MVNLEQYPDTIVLTLQIDPIYNNQTGEWSEPTIETKELKCRFKPSSNKTITLVDGSSYVYSYIIAIPFDSKLNILPDTEFIGYDKSGIEITKGLTKMFHIGQLHSLLWV